MGLLNWLKNVLGGGPGPEEYPGCESQTTAAHSGRRQLAARFAEVEEHLQGGNAARAEQSCRRVSARLEELAQGETSAEMQNVLGAGYFDLGSSYRRLGKQDEAERAYEHALTIWEALASANPKAIQYRGSIASCRNHLGILFENAEMLDQAERAYRDALIIREELATVCPDDRENQVYWGGTLCNLGHIARQREQTHAALEWYERSIQVLKRSMPHCDCGCQRGIAHALSRLTGRPHWMLLAHQFLDNALAGRGRLVPDTNSSNADGVDKLSTTPH